MQQPDIIITEQDSERLTRMLDHLPEKQRTAADGLERELGRARLVTGTDVPHDVVTMNSRVLIEETETCRRLEVVLVYPHDTYSKAGAISVLAPVGSALLGMRTGQAIDWPLPRGRQKRYRVVEVLYQPEAAGDYHL